MSHRFLATLFALGCVLSVSACANTIRGVGSDVGNSVDATEQATRDVVN